MNSPERTVNYSVEGSIAYVELNRPGKHNGLNQSMIRSLVDCAHRIKKDRTVRAVILSGAGDSFCAGLDFKHVSKNPSIIPKYFIKLPWSRDNMFQRVANAWRELPVPVISVLHGNCFGGGFQIAIACDFRIAEPSTQLSIMEMKWGLIPDMSGMVNLSRLTSLDIAQELTMTGKKFSAEDAKGFGLVSHLAEDPMKAARQLALELSAQSPDAIAAAKYLFRKTWKKGARGALLWERLTQLRLLGRKNQKIALKNGFSSAEDRRPYINRTSF